MQSESGAMMSAWVGRLRGLAGLGAIGGAVGAAGGGLWYAISGLLSGTSMPALIGGAAAVYGVFGAFSATVLGVSLASTRNGRALEDIGVAWSALVGGVAGALFPLLVNLWMIGALEPLPLLEQFLPIMARLGFLGAALTAGMVTVAKRAGRQELGGVGEPAMLRE